MKIGIVGHEALKFTKDGEARARTLIQILLLKEENPTLVSGGCHLGGIDIWAEEIADEYKIPKIIHYPEVLSWEKGYRPRNILIARDSEIIHCINVNALPGDFRGMRFSKCYHCNTDKHIKSGGCWTAKYAAKHFNSWAQWHTIDQSR